MGLFKLFKKKDMQPELPDRGALTQPISENYEQLNVQQNLQPQSFFDKDMELILSRLETINAKIDNLIRRLEILEKQLNKNQQQEQQPLQYKQSGRW